MSGASSRVLALAETNPVSGERLTISRPLKPSMPSDVPAEMDSSTITPMVPPPTIRAPLPQATSLSWRSVSRRYNRSVAGTASSVCHEKVANEPSCAAAETAPPASAPGPLMPPPAARASRRPA